MRIKFVRWGNSLALRIPSAFAKEVGATEGKRAEMTVENGALVIKVAFIARLRKRRRYSLDELLANFDPDAHRADVEAWDRAPPVGREVFDDAPELTQGMAERADLYHGDRLIQPGKGGLNPRVAEAMKKRRNALAKK